jgi:hypothetical protein
LKLSVYKRRGKREMPEHEIENQEPESPAPQRRRRLSRRNLTIVGVVAAIGIAILLLVSVVSYRYGVFDPWIKSQFTAKMADIGIEFTADEFALSLAPMELHLVNATFNDRVTGEKLFFIRDARLGLTVDNLYAWQLSRDISINTTDIDGAEVWVNFDENGRSNFANLKLVEEAPGRVNFKYDTIVFGGGLYHVGINGLKLLKDNLRLLENKRIAVFAVGASPVRESTVNVVKKDNFTADMLETIPFFLLRGGFNYQKCKTSDKLLMLLLKAKLKMKKNRQPDEIGMLNTYKYPADWTNRKATAPIVAFIQNQK